jgi:hypothetical protein
VAIPEREEEVTCATPSAVWSSQDKTKEICGTKEAVVQ